MKKGGGMRDHDADPRGGHGPIRGESREEFERDRFGEMGDRLRKQALGEPAGAVGGDFRQGCACSCCDHGEGSDCACDCHAKGKCAVGAVGGVPPPELEQIIERMRRMAMDARQSRENPLNIEADGYYSGAEALEYFANQLAAASRVVRPEPDLDIEHELRMEWWLNHGHDGLYGDDGEMQCGQCHPVFDYKRAPLAEVKAAAEKARLERIKASLAAARVARGDASAEQEE